MRTFAEVVREFEKEARSLERIYLVLYSERDYGRAVEVLGGG